MILPYYKLGLCGKSRWVMLIGNILLMLGLFLDLGLCIPSVLLAILKMYYYMWKIIIIFALIAKWGTRTFTRRKIVFCNLSYEIKKSYMQLFWSCMQHVQLHATCFSCIRQVAKDNFFTSDCLLENYVSTWKLITLEPCLSTNGFWIIGRRSFSCEGRTRQCRRCIILSFQVCSYSTYCGTRWRSWWLWPKCGGKEWNSHWSILQATRKKRTYFVLEKEKGHAYIYSHHVVASKFPVV